MTWMLLFVVFGLTAEPDVPQRADTSNVKLEQEPPALAEGYYKVSGKSKGKAYNGVAILKKVHGVYTVSYTVNYHHFNAVGLFKDNTLTISWPVPEGSGMTILRMNGNSLDGIWVSLPGIPQAQPEGWTFWAPLEKQDEPE